MAVFIFLTHRAGAAWPAALLAGFLFCGCDNEQPAAGSPAPTGTRPARPAQPSGTRAAQPAEEAQLSDAAAAERQLGGYVGFPSGRVELRMPDGFTKAENFDGFAFEEARASIMVVSMPGPFAEISGGFRRETIKARGWTLHDRSEYKVGEFPAVLVHFEQPAGGQVFWKWSLIFGDASRTTMLTATMPDARRGELSDLLKAAVLSARPLSSEVPTAGEDAPFLVTASPKLKLTPALNRSLLYTREGTIPTKSPDEPLFIVAASVGDAAAADHKEFAGKRLRQTAQMKDTALESEGAITIDGLEGWEMTAGAKHAKSGAGMFVYQVMLFDEGSYILMQGIAGAAHREEFLPEFQDMASSFKRKADR